MKVLLVDDEEDVRLVANFSLSRVGGMEVIEATTGEEAIAAARNENPDFILLDVMMPGMDGPAAFDVLRQDPATAHIPVVFLTAKAMLSDVSRLKELGARGVVLKPFDPMELPDEILAFLDAR